MKLGYTNQGSEHLTTPGMGMKLWKKPVLVRVWSESIKRMQSPRGH